MTTDNRDNFDKLVTPDGLQTLTECKNSIKELGDNIGNSDMTSCLTTSYRIHSMRVLLDLFEDYNNQLAILHDRVDI